MNITIEQLKGVCPKLEDMEEPACPMAELIWIKYLAYSLVNQNRIPTSEVKVEKAEAMATVITKFDGGRSYETKLVLRCDINPILEGVILSPNGDHEPLRPFCLGARYDKMPQPRESLMKTVEKVGLSHTDKDGLEHVFNRLILMNRLTKQIGTQFWNNLHIYAQHLDSRGITKNVWLDD